MIAVAAVIVVIVVVLAAILLYVTPGYLVSHSSSTAPRYSAGGFTRGQVVTFLYNGTDTYLCTPAMSVMYPGNSTAASASSTTSCEVGNASQNAVPQVPEWILVPAFAGLSIFGVTALGATADGLPAYNGTTIGVDCGAGGSKTACVDHPTYLFSPLFTAVEDHLSLGQGYGGLPLGVLPTPAHEHLIDTPPTYPNVQWGTIAVLVFDPNIWPSPTTGACTALVGSNLSAPTGHCLTSLAGLTAALTTCSSAVAHANAREPIWATLGDPCAQVVVPGVTVVSELSNLNGNLYIPFAVTPGVPSFLPS